MKTGTVIAIVLAGGALAYIVSKANISDAPKRPKHRGWSTTGTYMGVEYTVRELTQKELDAGWAPIVGGVQSRFIAEFVFSDGVTYATFGPSLRDAERLILKRIEEIVGK
jgi:hypothetical protein